MRTRARIPQVASAFESGGRQGMDEYSQSFKLVLEEVVHGPIQDKRLVGGVSLLIPLWWYIGLFEIHEIIARTEHYDGGISDKSGKSCNQIFR